MNKLTLVIDSFKNCRNFYIFHSKHAFIFIFQHDIYFKQLFSNTTSMLYHTHMNLGNIFQILILYSIHIADQVASHPSRNCGAGATQLSKLKIQVICVIQRLKMPWKYSQNLFVYLYTKIILLNYIYFLVFSKF